MLASSINLGAHFLQRKKKKKKPLLDPSDHCKLPQALNMSYEASRNRMK